MKFDLKNGFNLICIAEGYERKTAFKTWYRAFEFTVMPWGLTNAPAIFQQLMNYVLGELMNRSMIIYIDNILIYSATEDKHIKLATKVITLLHEAGSCG